MLTLSDGFVIDPTSFSLNHLVPGGFRFYIQKLPKVSFWVQSVAIPAVSLGVANQATPLVDIPRAGDKLAFDRLTLTFLVQEDMANYRELYDWIISLGAPQSKKQFANKFGLGLRRTDENEFSDGALLVLNSEKKPVAQFFFDSLVPTALSSLPFEVVDGSTKPLTATATFAYTQYAFSPLDT